MWFSSIFKPNVDAEAIVRAYYASSDRWCNPKKHATVTKLRLFDFDREFHQDPNAMIVPCGQELDGVDVANNSIETIKKMLFQESDSNLNFIASCKCERTKGNFAKGTICPYCNTEVRDAFADEIKFRAWLEIPEFMPPMLHPAAYRILGKWMGCVKRKKKIIDLLLDVDSELPEPYGSILGQGPAYFYENFDNIINYFLNQNTGAKSKKNLFIKEFVDTYRNVMFIRHVPVLNQALHILTKSGTLTYNDDVSTSILETCIELSSAIYNYRHNPIAHSAANRNYLEQYSYNVYKSYLNYVEKITKIKLVSKYGFIRKSLLASRLNNTFRAVIVPIVTEHKADECHLPWRIGVAQWKLEIINFLVRHYHMSYPDAYEKHARALVEFDQDVYDVIQRLMDECPYKGLPVLLGSKDSSLSCESRIDHVTNCWQSLKPCSLTLAG